MADAFTGEIRIYPFTYAPQDWSFCTGQSVPVSQNQVLYAIIGNIYGGTAGVNFNLPNFQGVVPVHQGQGPGLTLRQVGDTTGDNSVNLTQAEIPVHTHDVISYIAQGTTTPTPDNQHYMSRASSGNAWSDQPPTTYLAPQTLQPNGGGYAHENRQPYLALNFCICLYGIFPVKAS